MLHVPDGGSNFLPRRSQEYVLYVKPGIKGLSNVCARHNGDGEGSPLRHSKG